MGIVEDAKDFKNYLSKKISFEEFEKTKIFREILMRSICDDKFCRKLLELIVKEK